MKKLSTFLAAIMMFGVIAASMGNAETVQAFPESEVDWSEFDWTKTSHAGCSISFSTTFRYDVTKTTSTSGWKVALCPEDNKTLAGAVATIDVPTSNITLNNIDGNYQYGSMYMYGKLANDIPEGYYVRMVFDADGNVISDGYFADHYVDKTLVSVDCDLVNNDGYAYAYVYSDSPALNASVYPTFYAADKTTAVTSYNDYTVQKNGADTVHIYRLNILDSSAFELDSTGHTTLYYQMGTPILESGNDGGVAIGYSDANGFGYTTVFDLNNWAKTYGISINITDPFSSASAGGSQSPTAGTVVTAPVESEHVLPNGEEVRMVTVKGNSTVYVIGNPNYIPTGATFESSTVTTGDVFNAAKAAVEKKFGNVDFQVFEMNLLDASNQKITELNGYINVTLPIPAGMATEDGETIVVYRVENGKMIKCDTAVANGQVTFATNHFSTYVLVEVNAMTSPKTGDANMMPMMVIVLVLMAGAVVVSKKRNAI